MKSALFYCGYSKNFALPVTTISRFFHCDCDVIKEATDLDAAPDRDGESEKGEDV